MYAAANTVAFLASSPVLCHKVLPNGVEDVGALLDYRRNQVRRVLSIRFARLTRMPLIEIFITLKQKLAASQPCNDTIKDLSQYLKHFRPILRRAFGGTAADEDEILNTVCEKIWKGVRKFRGQSEGEAYNYCRTIVQREIINYIRHIGATVGAVSLTGPMGGAAVPAEDTGTSVEEGLDPSTAADGDSPDPVEAAEDRRHILVALDRLNPVERDLVWLNLIEGVQIAEIARGSGETQEALSKRKERALAKLRQVLPSYLAEGRKLAKTRVGRGSKRRQPAATRDLAAPPPAIDPPGNPRPHKRGRTGKVMNK